MLPAARVPCPVSRRTAVRRIVRMGWVRIRGVSCCCAHRRSSRARRSSFVDLVRVEEVVQELWWHQNPMPPASPFLACRVMSPVQCLIGSQLVWDRGWPGQWRRRVAQKMADLRVVRTAWGWDDWLNDLDWVWVRLSTSFISGMAQQRHSKAS